MKFTKKQISSCQFNYKLATRLISRAKSNLKFLKFNLLKLIWQLSETVSDDRGISARIGRPWTAGGDVAVDRLMWQAVCVVGRRLAGVGGSRSSSSSNSNNNNISCLPVIDTKSLEIRNFVRTQIWLDRLKMLLRSRLYLNIEICNLPY